VIVDVPRLLEALKIKAREHGRELWAPCPNPSHNETRPSWSIKDDPHDPSNGAHFCFGCQFTGDAVALVAAVVGITPGSAYRWIKDRGLTVQGSLSLAVKLEVRNRYANGLQIPSKLIGGELGLWASPVRKYAVSRGLTQEQIERWEICYAVDGAMAGRLVFPCKDWDDQWLSWHARTYCGQDKRYKNASHADGFDEGALFGMRWWPEPVERRVSVMVLTEGAIDALACEREGADYIGALGGSDPHARQLLKLSTWGRILVASDGDKAGDKLFTTVAHAIGGKVDVRRVDMPRVVPGDKWDAGKLAVKRPGVLGKLLCLANDAGKDESRAAPTGEPSKSSTQPRLIRRRLLVRGNG
jgi:DNA primase